MRQQRVMFGLMAFLLVFWSTARFGVAPVEAARTSDVRSTKHNLSASGTGTVHANSTQTVATTDASQVCVFCHTPHGAQEQDLGGGAVPAPLWNRKVPAGSTYTAYTSSSLDAQSIADGFNNQPGGSSKLCLSCHDGTLAIGNVGVLGGKQNIAIDMVGTNAGTMPLGQGDTTGFTRKLGSDLTNDHPISVTFNSALVAADGEMRPIDATNQYSSQGSVNLPSGITHAVGIRNSPSGTRPLLPLEKTSTSGKGQVQCATCHNPHIKDTAADHNIKFLRANRLQTTAGPTGGNFNANNDIICLACHDKAGIGWAFSAHANPTVADETYTANAATVREFPAAMPVWRAACLNCHDTHTVPGARKLLREATNDTNSPKQGGLPAQEQACYACHTTSAASAVTAVTQAVPNIKDDFALATHMPVANTTEVHDVGGQINDGIVNCTSSGWTGCGKDLVEARGNLGVGDLTKRHVECTDCHNPHRVIRAKNGLPGTLSAANTADTIVGRTTGLGTHAHTDANGYVHSNAISGVLRGSWGVEPTYNSASFHSLPSGYTVKRGDPGSSTSTLATETFVTREYQICLKCHSDYGYSDNNAYPTGNRPTLGYTGGTASTTNGLTMYTNVAKEIQAPAGHDNEPLNLGTAAGSSDANYNNNNHRSWHPVMAPTGRTTAKRGMSGGNPWLPPWNNTNAVGAQTMYCTDCHGSALTTTKTVIPADGSPWGPHGSSNNFILKGVWGNGMGATGQTSGVTANLLCFKCHDQANYSTNNDSGQKSGFYGGGKGNLHNYHVDRIQKLYCTWCHVAVPHGWKNKALLVNLNDVGEEAGLGAGTSKEVATNGNGSYYKKEPYYLYSKNKIASFAASGSWSDTNCGSAGKSGANLITSTDGASATNTTGTGKNWMTSTCKNPTN